MRTELVPFELKELILLKIQIMHESSILFLARWSTPAGRAACNCAIIYLTSVRLAIICLRILGHCRLWQLSALDDWRLIQRTG